MLMPKAAEARRKGVSGQTVHGWSKNVLRRPTHYRDEWADWAPGLCKRGLTDAERARAFAVNERTLIAGSNGTRLTVSP